MGEREGGREGVDERERGRRAFFYLEVFGYTICCTFIIPTYLHTLSELC